MQTCLQCSDTQLTFKSLLYCTTTKRWTVLFFLCTFHHFSYSFTFFLSSSCLLLNFKWAAHIDQVNSAWLLYKLLKFYFINLRVCSFSHFNISFHTLLFILCVSSICKNQQRTHTRKVLNVLLLVCFGWYQYIRFHIKILLLSKLSSRSIRACKTSFENRIFLQCGRFSLWVQLDVCTNRNEKKLYAYNMYTWTVCESD